MKEALSIDGTQCPECGRGTLRTMLRTEDFEFDLGSDGLIKVHAVNVPIEKCDICGEEISGPSAARIRDEALRQAAGLLTPLEIKAVRDKFGWSQQYLSDLTDFGIAMISCWEHGRLLQNRS